MKIEEIFENSGYIKITNEQESEKYNLNTLLLFDRDQNNQRIKPKELVDIYLSDNGDELFVVLKSDDACIKKLCGKWDRKLSAFVNFGSDNNEVLNLFMYNIVLIILCSTDISDSSRVVEGSLLISRKFILECDVNGELKENEEWEIPFYFGKVIDKKIDTSEFLILEKKLPSDRDKCWQFVINVKNKKDAKRLEDGTLDKSYSEDEFNLIAGWLRNES